MILDRINNPNDIKYVDNLLLDELAKEIREEILVCVSKTGGHLASNLGTVELTMALHKYLTFPEDKLIFDVGHQCYTHKILTGRKNEFSSLRQYKGLSGFPKRDESDCDSYDTGHSSTSISAALGYAAARKLRGSKEKIVAVIGDGSMTGGEAFEALNNASMLEDNLIIVLNDNTMSISKNVGGLPTLLSRMRTGDFYQSLKKNVTNSLERVPLVGEHMISTIRRTKNGLKQLFIPGMYFEEMGIKYIGPVDGHKTMEIYKTLEQAGKVDGPVLIHVVTNKGQGYGPAEKHPSKFHGTGAFDLNTGLSPKKAMSYTDVFSKVIVKEAKENKKIVAITAAMDEGTGLKEFRQIYPDRFFDVGIAEQDAVSFATGLALGGYTPVFAVYSSFLQRGFDQVAMDVCMQNQHVVFMVDRAGLVGNDGPTHHGAFDFAYLAALPNMQVLAPMNKWELADMIRYALMADGPVAVRYPRGSAFDELKDLRSEIVTGKGQFINQGEKVCLVAIGAMVKESYKALLKLKEDGINAGLFDARFMKPLDKDSLLAIGRSYNHVITLEDHSVSCGFGVQVSDLYQSNGITLKSFSKIGIPDYFVEQGSTDDLYRECGMDCDSIVSRVKALVED